MDGLIRALEWVSNKMKAVGAICLVGMTFLTCADVVGRFFRHPIFGSVEIVGYMATLAVAMALPYTHQVKGHIGVEILVRMVPEKVQTVIDIFTGFLSLVHRLHVPVTTNKGVVFTIDDEDFYLEPGWLYELNNLLRHSVANNSSESRVHLLVDLLPRDDNRFFGLTYHD